MADICEVKAFINKMRELLNQGLFDLVPRRKNLDSIKKAGLMIKHVKEILSNLSYENYSKGPLADIGYKRQGYVWEFGYDIEGTEFYIKLKIEERNRQQYIICLSFHEAEFILKYPLRENK